MISYRHIPRGFTLIELMLAVAIIGLLMSIVIPNYMESVRRGHRSDGMDALTAAAQKMEVVKARTGTYPTTLAAANISATSADGYYGNLTIAPLRPPVPRPVVTCCKSMVRMDKKTAMSRPIASIPLDARNN